jgi:hypothetical protein
MASKGSSQVHKFFKNVLMIDPVRQRGLYRFTLASIPLMAGLLIASAYAEDEMQRRIDVIRRDRERTRRLADDEKLRKVRNDGRRSFALAHFLQMLVAGE